MNEDAPGGVRPFTQAGTITLSCAIGCGETNRVPAFEDKQERDPRKRVKPVGSGGPYICLGCWRAGWRAEGPFEDGWHVYNCESEERRAPWKP